MSIFHNNYLINHLEIQMGEMRRADSVFRLGAVDINLSESDDIHVKPTPTYIDKRGV
jgi:hypothetical protein